jgi:nucleotide-binding universal stress UspA family protein
MTRIHRILCPVDFSEFSKHALDHAVVLARWYEAELVVLHVAPLVAVFPLPGGTTRANLEAFDPDVMTRELRSFVGGAVEALPRLQMIVRAGAPASLILECAREVEADLLVLGTHGRTGFERFMLGSVTEKVILKATSPVLTVPRGVDNGPDGGVFRNILCGVDFSDASLRALQYALSLASEATGRLTLLHVVEWMPETTVPIQPHFDFQRYGESLVSEARARLTQLVPDEIREWCEIDISVRVGKPYQEILGTATRGAADLIVMGVQGRGPVDRMLFGSTTQHVVRKAPCPVLTVRP